VLADRRYTLYLLAMLVNATVYVQYLGTLPLAVRDAGLAVGVYGALVALNGFIVVTCELLVTKVVQRWPARIVVAVAFVLLGGGLACYALPWGLAAFVTGTLVWTLAEIVGGPTMFAYPAQAAPIALRGRYLGSAHAMFGLGSAIGPVLGVAAWEAFGRGVWVACGLACLLGLAAALAGIRPTPAAEPTAAPHAGAAADGEVAPGAAEPARAAAAVAVAARDANPDAGPAAAGVVADLDAEPEAAAGPRLAVSAVPSDAH